MKTPRDILATQTGSNAMGTLLIAIVLALVTHFAEPAKTRLPDFADIIDASQQFILEIAPVALGLTGMGCLQGRMRATDDVYSKNWLPGRSRKDIVEEDQ